MVTISPASQSCVDSPGLAWPSQRLRYCWNIFPCAMQGNDVSALHFCPTPIQRISGCQWLLLHFIPVVFHSIYRGSRESTRFMLSCGICSEFAAGTDPLGCAQCADWRRKIQIITEQHESSVRATWVGFYLPAWPSFTFSGFIFSITAKMKGGDYATEDESQSQWAW